MRVAVFLSSSPQVSPMFLAEAEQLGAHLARAGHSVVYGGMKSGCMGALAQGVVGQKGALIGVIPEIDLPDGLVQMELTESHVVTTLSHRKTRLVELSDAFVIFPGGIGTLDEAFEVLALKSIGSLDRPVVFYNFLDAWTPVLEALEILFQSRMIKQPLDELMDVVETPEELMRIIRHDV
ncbi:MAG: TIGR00730 family Rossman fold protein [Bdellovibrionales bacterium]